MMPSVPQVGFWRPVQAGAGAPVADSMTRICNLNQRPKFDVPLCGVVVIEPLKKQ